MLDETGLFIGFEVGWKGAKTGLGRGGVGIVVDERIEGVTGGLTGVEELAFVVADVGVEAVTAVHAHLSYDGYGIPTEGNGRFGHTRSNRQDGQGDVVAGSVLINQEIVCLGKDAMVTGDESVVG